MPLSSYALHEELDFQARAREQDAHPRQFAPGCQAQPWCAVMLGQALPPAEGDPTRVFAAVRYTQSSQGPTLWRWDGERRKVGPTAALEYWASLPAYARVLDLSEPSPIGLASGVWRLGPWVYPAWWAAAEARVRSAFAPLAGAQLSLIVFDAEDRCDPWELKRLGQWEAVLADERLPALLAECQITREDLERIGSLKPAEAGLDMAWHRWCEVTHRMLAEQLGTIGRWIAESGVSGTVVNCSHYKKIPNSCAPERAGVYHAAVVGSGSTPAGASVVKQYGLNDGQVWDESVGANNLCPNTDWARLLRDYRRIAGCHQAGWGRVVALGQANVTDPQGPLGWLTSERGQQSLAVAGMISGEPLIFSQRQNDPKEEPLECLAQQRAIESLLALLDEITGGMGCRADWLEPGTFPGPQADQVRVQITKANGQRHLLMLGDRDPVEPPEPPVVVRETLPPKLVTGEVHLTSGDYARTALVVQGDAVIHFEGAEINYGLAGEDLSQGIHLLSESSDDGVSRRLAAELGIELGQGTIARNVRIGGAGKLTLRPGDKQPWRCHAIGGGGDAGELIVDDLELASGGVDGCAVWAPYRTTRLERVLCLGAKQHRNRPDALPAVMVGQTSFLNRCGILGGQAAVQVRDDSRIERCLLAAVGPFTGAYALPMLSVNRVAVHRNLILGDRGILLERDGAGPTCESNTIANNTILVYELEKNGEGNYGRDGTAYGIRTRYGTKRNTIECNYVFAFGGHWFTGCAAAGLTDYPVDDADANLWNANVLCAAYFGPPQHPGDFAKALTIESAGGPEAATSQRPTVTNLRGCYLWSNHRGLSLAGYDGLGYTRWHPDSSVVFKLKSFAEVVDRAAEICLGTLSRILSEGDTHPLVPQTVENYLGELRQLNDSSRYGGQHSGSGFLWRGNANRAPLWPGLEVQMPAEYLDAGWHLATS